MTYKSTIATWLLLSATAFAQLTLEPSRPVMVPVEQNQPMVWREVQAVSSPIEESAKCVVKVRFPSGNGFSSGSGVYLGERLVATAYHVPRGTSGRGYATFRDGFATECTVIQSDKLWDQCIVELDQEHPSLMGVELAEKNPRAGEMVYSSGFGAGFRIFGGKVTGQWASPTGREQTTDWFHHANEAIPGDSGGPVFNEAGKLIGCLWGSGGGETVATGTGRFNVFVKPLFPRLAQWRANRIAGQILGIAPNQGCYNGQCPPQGGVSTFPGTRPTEPIPFEPPQNTPSNPQGPGCQCDVNKIADTVIKKIIDGNMISAGKDGRDGKDGKDGIDGEVTEEHLAAITANVVKAMLADGRFRGPEGPAGKDAELDIESLVKAVTPKIQFPPQRVVMVDGKSGKIIDDETYQPGEPIVLDFQSIIRSARMQNN